MGVVWQGAKEIAEKLKRISKKIPSAKSKFLMQEAEKLKTRVKLKTPVDTGNLRNNWFSTAPSKNNITVYNNVEYAAFVEFGHRTVKGDGFVAGQFMLRDAVDEAADNFVKDANDILKNIMEG